MGIDGEARQYTRMRVGAAFETKRATLDHVMNTTPPMSKVTALGRRASLRLLPATESIDGFPITALSLTMPGQSWRIWVAMTLPRAPSDIQAGLSGLVPVDASSQATLARIAGFPIVRTEIIGQGKPKRVLDTKTIRQIQMPASALEPPVGFTERPLAPEPPRRKPRKSGSKGGGAYMLNRTPGRAHYDVPALVVRGPGPEMSNPELYVVFRGKHLNDTSSQVARDELAASMSDMVRPQYLSPLGQYDIRSGAVKGFYRRSDLPPRAAGSSNFAAITDVVYNVGFNDGAPIFWWAVGGHDPLYVVLVTESEVDSGGWDGYHFVAFSLTHAVLPFPASLFAHDAIPWAFAKIPDGAFAMPLGARLHRQTCNQFRLSNPVAAWPAGIAAACSTIAPFDKGTTSISHEVVEAASDPYVFLGWSDPGQQPFWARSELADICLFNPTPWIDRSVVRQTMLSTYWSNVDHACVPESRPALTVFEPAAGQAVMTTTGNTTARGHALDPVDGDISNRITWKIDGAARGMGASVNTGPLSGGNHILTAAVTNSRGLDANVVRSFSVNAIPVTLTIDTPVESGNFGVNQQIVFRGRAFRSQPGDIPDSALQWDDNGTVIGTGPLLVQRLSTPGAHVVRLSVLGTGGTPIASEQRSISLVAAAKGRPSLVIAQPAANSVFRVEFGSDRSGPITFSATITDGAGNTITPKVSWTSDVDGALGSGGSLTTTLKGGHCAPFTHHIRATTQTGASRITHATDVITLTIGQVC